MEIDCDNKKTLDRVIKLFNPPKDKIAYGASGAKYELYYGIPQKKFDNNTPLVTFKTIDKQIKPKKNKQLFRDTVKKQKKKYVK